MLMVYGIQRLYLTFVINSAFKVSKFLVHNAPLLLRRRRWRSREYDAARDVAALSLVHIIIYAAQKGPSSLVIPHLLLSGRWKIQMRGQEKFTCTSTVCWTKENKYVINRLVRQFCWLLHRPKSNNWHTSVHKTPTTLAYVNISFSLTSDNLGYYADGKLDFFPRLRRPLVYIYDLYSREIGFKSRLAMTILIF
jgi:hypothetical protein